jgi:CRISPR-associated protein Cmr3
MSRVGLCLEPLDVLFFRDGRSFDAATRVTSGLPTPQVLAGAVRTALLEKYGYSFARLKPAMAKYNEFKPAVEATFSEQAWIGAVKFRGPWLCRLPNAETGTELDVFLPVPVALHVPKKGATRKGGPNVFPVKVLWSGVLPGWNRDRLRPLWQKETDTEPATGFVDSKGLESFLNGGVPGADNIHSADRFYGFDNRTGIGIDAARATAGAGEIYSIRFLSMRCDYGFYAEIELPDDKGMEVFDSISVLAFGGEGKRVAVRSLAKPFAFPAPPKCGPNQKRLVVLSTLGIPKQRHETDYHGEPLAAAAVNAPVTISGWDIAKGGPKPAQFAVPAGSVYFLDTDTEVPDRPDEFGYGCHLQGVWTDG